MNELQKTIKEQIELREKEFPENDKKEHKVKFIGAKYFTVCKNGEIYHSFYDEILGHNDIEFAIVFPKIGYVPNTAPNETYLEPIIVNSEMEVFKGKLFYSDWFVRLYEQDLRNRPRPIEILIENSKIGFDKKNIYFTSNIYHEKFHLHLRIILSILKCKSKEEAELMFRYYEKDVTIHELEHKIRILNQKIKE